jgi:hypothetical protein
MLHFFFLARSWITVQGMLEVVAVASSVNGQTIFYAAMCNWIASLKAVHAALREDKGAGNVVALLCSELVRLKPGTKNGHVSSTDFRFLKGARLPFTDAADPQQRPCHSSVSPVEFSWRATMARFGRGDVSECGH